MLISDLLVGQVGGKNKKWSGNAIFTS